MVREKSFSRKKYLKYTLLVALVVLLYLLLNTSTLKYQINTNTSNVITVNALMVKLPFNYVQFSGTVKYNNKTYTIGTYDNVSYYISKNMHKHVCDFQFINPSFNGKSNEILGGYVMLHKNGHGFDSADIVFKTIKKPGEFGEDIRFFGAIKR